MTPPAATPTRRPERRALEEHDRSLLMANVFARTEAPASGKTADEVRAESAHEAPLTHDSSTNALIRRYRAAREKR